MRIWTPEEVQVLKDLAHTGASRTRIAARLKRTVIAVTVEAKKHGIKLKSHKQIRTENGLSRSWADNCAF